MPQAMIRRYFVPVLRRKRFYVLLLILAGLAYLYDVVEARLTDRTFVEKLSDNAYGYQAKASKLENGWRDLRYVEVGDAKKPLILFIHGAPASSSFWIDLLRDSVLLGEAKMMAVDRPGYGYSGYGKPETSVKKQAALIAQLLRQKRGQHQKIIVHGSSYGGTVAARLAMDYPELVDGLLLQSASLEPGAETTYWISYPTFHWALSWLVPGSIHTANAEKLSHRAELAAMNHWNKIRSKVIVLHGSDDRLIFPSNAWYAYNRLINASMADLYIVKGSKHDLLWTQRPLLKQSLLCLLGKKQAVSGEAYSNLD
jgi:pimeloyl-ACP methyl ester carboxylesterase